MAAAADSCLECHSVLEGRLRIPAAVFANDNASKAKAFGYALFAWFFFVLFHDLLVIGMTFVLKEHTANQFIVLSLFGNPVDLARVGSLMALGDRYARAPDFSNQAE